MFSFPRKKTMSTAVDGSLGIVDITAGWRAQGRKVACAYSALQLSSRVWIGR